MLPFFTSAPRAGRHLLAATCAWAALTGAHAAAPSTAPASFKTDQVEVSLVPAHASVKPGEKLVVGLHQRIIPHWHTYWRNPGDSGVATTISWQLPQGAQAGDIQWPVPHHFDLGPITNYGYENAVTLLTDIQVPKDLSAGQPFVIEAKANWLVCADTCIPQSASLSLSLPVAAPDALTPPAHPLINAATRQLPTEAPWPVQAQLKGTQLTLALPAAAHTAGATLKDVRFYPSEWGHLTHNAPQVLAAEGGTSQLQLSTGEQPPQPGQALPGVLVVSETVNGQVQTHGYTVAPTVTGVGAAPADPNATAQSAPATAPTTSQEAAPTWAAALLLAFVGGLILNLMPCVFPVLSIKALSMLAHADQGPARIRLQGLVYTAGVLASFGGLAALLLVLKATGTQVGWGFQFQSPLFVLVMAYLMLAVGLNLSGVFTIGGALTGVGSSLADREGLAGSFFTGVLATVVATPCTAPFMGGAIGFALGQPPLVVLSVFLSLGLGLATPYLLLSWWPKLQHRLPRPGAWMERFKQALAFPMYAAAAWLVWVLAQQAGVNAAGVVLLGMVGIAFAAWVYDISRHSAAPRRMVGSVLAAAGVLAALTGGQASLALGAPEAGGATAQAERHWQPYSPSTLSELRAKGAPVFINMTAAWCITCLANERVALSQDSVKAAFKARGIQYLKGDWTNQDPDISKLLSQFGRSGVPLYVYYPPGAQSQPVVLPQILTTAIVIDAVKDAPAKVALSPTSIQP